MSEEKTIAKTFAGIKQNIQSLDPKLQEEVLSRPLYTILNNEDEDSMIASEYLKQIEKDEEFLATVPDTFNGPEVWSMFLSPSKNQGNCGGCWSFAATSVLADRFNILSRGKYQLDLSPVMPIICEVGGKYAGLKTGMSAADIQKEESSKLFSASCYGNSIINAFRYLYLRGATENYCHPYDLQGTRFVSLQEFQTGAQLPLCPAISGTWKDMCIDFDINNKSGDTYGTPARHFRCVTVYTVPGTEEQGGSELQIRANIYRWGPIATGFDIYPDFYTFDAKKEIYKWNGEGEKIGGHAVCIVGWGEENGVKFWWVRNSWGPEWGINGFFKFLRGENHLHIEANCVAGMPDFFYPPSLYFYDQETVNQHKYLEQDVKLRQLIDSGTGDVTAGGLDPYTGFSRRVQEVFPYYDFSPPVKLEDIPDMKTIIAGKVEENNKTGVASVSQGETGVLKNVRAKVAGSLFETTLALVFLSGWLDVRATYVGMVSLGVTVALPQKYFQKGCITTIVLMTVIIITGKMQ